LSNIISIIRHQINHQPKVKVFLDTIARNSLKTRRNYETSLVHLQEFLNKYGGNHSLETIIYAILNNEINLYELIDNFIAYENTKGVKLTPQSIRSYLVGIKSYFAY
jgi:hypothetical protein